MNYLEKGERKKLEEWVKQNEQGMEERKKKHVEESLNYLQKNWKGIRKRIKKEEEIKYTIKPARNACNCRKNVL